MQQSENVMELPEEWDDFPSGFPLIDEGTYKVTVVTAEHQNNKNVQLSFEVMDDGPFNGRRLNQWYSMKTEAGIRLFKELLDAIGVSSEGRNLDLNPCLRAVLTIRVKHNENNGQTYANVVHHARPND